MYHDILRTLTQPQETPCVSIYVPLQAGVAHAPDNVRRILAAIDDVEAALQDTGLSPKGQKQYVAPARSFAEQEAALLTDGGTVALFLSPAGFQYVSLLQTDAECLTIGERFHLTPILPYAAATLRYYLLKVSKHAAHLYYIAHDRMEERVVDGMPQSIEEVRTMPREGQDAEENEEDRYMRIMAKSLHTLLRTERLPLVFAGVPELFGLFRTFDKSDCLLSRSVQGSADATDSADMREKADSIVRESRQGEVQTCVEEYLALSGTGRTSTDPAVILDAALRGKVDLLLAADGAEVWGRFDAAENVAVCHERREQGDEELVGLAAAHTLVHHGRYVAVDMSHLPESASMAAILRY